jgi:hypothetical protein
MIAARVKVDFSVDRSAHKMAAVTAHHVILFALLLNAELENKGILAGESLVVSGIKLLLLSIVVSCTKDETSHTWERTMTTGPPCVTFIMNFVL